MPAPTMKNPVEKAVRRRVWMYAAFQPFDEGFEGSLSKGSATPVARNPQELPGFSLERQEFQAGED